MLDASVLVNKRNLILKVFAVNEAEGKFVSSISIMQISLAEFGNTINIVLVVEIAVL